MQAIYHLSSSQEITFDLLESIRNTFKSKPITIVVDEEIDETAYLMSSENNKKMHEKSMLQYENGEVIILRDL